MGLPRTFVGFSSSDIHYYRLMCAWKEHDHIDFNFADCQLADSINSDNEDYIKRLCRARIDLAGYFIQLIGDDTRSKHKYVRWELDVAVEKGCKIIGVNLDGSRVFVPNKTPPLMHDIGAVFVSFQAKAIACALQLKTWNAKGNWTLKDETYKSLGL